ncbi:FadR/GntR family transcriptional regulator [Consotaella aegiceratis]|uniref:FadR/GntR family transcriptional regulator n=1 Tax=Consotaella aegiceratis TaxID=3097961 RepID=UPI002F3F22FC
MPGASGPIKRGELPQSRSPNKSARRLHGDIARDLGVAIVSGRYKSGDLLPGEIEFSAALGVSRTAYREGVRMLDAKGLVESRPKTGTRVTPRHRWRFLDPDVLGWFFEAGEPDPAFLRGLFELRTIVEPPAAALAASRRSDAQVAAMATALDDMDRLTLATEEGRDADRLFHDTILSASGNEVLASLSTGIGAAIRWTTLYKHRTQPVPRNAMDDHRAVFAAIRSAQPDAAQEAMTRLVERAMQDLE